MLDALKVWDGSQLVDTSGEAVIISFSTLERQSSTCAVEGFDLAAQANGGWHRHFTFFLAPDIDGVRDDGVYALKLRLYGTDSSLAHSDPFWIVFRQNASIAQQDAAMQWIASTLINASCPADLDHDHLVGSSDLLTVIGNWGGGPCSPADVDDDGFVGVADLLEVIGTWGPYP